MARLLIALGSLLLVTAGRPARALDPFQPASSGGLATVERALARLDRNCRLLLVGAHPDDEDTTLLALVARGMGCEAAYLSLTRGEGGQNLIGSELGESLGVLRTEELLAARRIDGARQYFTRAYDFGYSKTVEEAIELWTEAALLEDAVRVGRRFLPHVVVSVFPDSPRAGHGQHQAAGWVAGRLFTVLGDPAVWSELAEEGLDPWSPALFYREAWFDPEAATHELPAGGLDPLTGRSYHQIAMESRSQHRCQSFGALQPPGPRSVRLTLEAARTEGTGPELYGDHDVRLRSVAALLPAGPARDRLAAELAEIEARVRAARARLTPAGLGEIVPDLADLTRRLRRARVGLPEAAAGRQVDRLLAEKEVWAVEALLAAAGVVVDATTPTPAAVITEAVEVEVLVWNGGERWLELPTSPGIVASQVGWRPAEVLPAIEEPTRLGPGAIWKAQVPVLLAAGAEPTVPYGLSRARTVPRYDWSTTAPAVRGEPGAPSPLFVKVALTVAASDESPPLTVELWREVVSKRRDLARGEVREPLRAVPRVEVTARPGQRLLPRGGGSTAELEVGLRRHGEATARGRVLVEVPAAWPASSPVPFEVAPPAQELSLAVTVATPPDLASGRYRVSVVAELETGERFALGLPLVDYEHIRPRPVPRPAEVDLVVLDLELPALSRVGYLRGGGDLVPEALTAVGVPLELLDPGELAALDLAVFDAIVVGARAFETSPELARANPRLLDYVRAGGTLVVQFQRWGYFEAQLAPYPMELTRSRRTRTTDEAGPVEPLAPEHPGLRTPNPIGEADWSGWVGERSTYNPVTWDSAYTPLVAMRDPGEEPVAGSLLVAEYGEGIYVYTGVAFFRQLPAGVPGAFRLFANLLGLSGAMR